LAEKMEQFGQSDPLESAHGLNLPNGGSNLINRYQSSLIGGKISLMMTKLGSKFADGRTAEVYTWGEDQILKLYRKGWPRRTAEFEHRQALASQQTGYRVPLAGEVIEINGRFGIIYQRVDGQTMMCKILDNPTTCIPFARQMADLHLEMHLREAHNMEPVTERLTWKIQTVQAFDEKKKSILLSHLSSLPQDNKLLHGDFHPGNIMLTPTGPVIIDWMDAVVGHPLADVARTFIIARFGIPPEERINRLIFRTMLRIYLKHYLQHSPYTRSQFEDWLLPVAAGRLSEEIPHETAPLHAYVNKLLKKLG
jgi:hypothetical protein